MAFAAEVPWEPDGPLPAATPGVDLAGLRALVRGRSRWQRQAAAEAQPPFGEEAGDPDETGPPKARRLIEPLTSWC
jgi:hypothetical protein